MASFLARRYAEPVDVMRRDDAPAQFLWRDRLYVVRAVLAHWMEAGGWWARRASRALLTGEEPGSAGVTPSATAPLPVRTRRAGHRAWGEPAPEVEVALTSGGVEDVEREFWRVEATAGRAAGTGVYDLCFDWAAGTWSVTAALD